MKPTHFLLLLVFTVLSINSVSAQYGGGYNNGYGGGGYGGGGYGGGGYGRSGGMGMDRSMMQGQQQGAPSKPKETPPDQIAAQIVEKMTPEVNLDELQAIAITNVLTDSMKEQGVLLKKEDSSQDQKLEQMKALRESTTKKITAFLNPDQIDKFNTFMANLKDLKKSKSKKKKDDKDDKDAKDDKDIKDVKENTEATKISE